MKHAAMRYLSLLIVLCICFSAYAQKAEFVRVYDLNGKKTHAGKLYAVTDSTVQLKGDTGVIIPISSIGFIKTKRAAGNNVLVGSVVGGVVTAILGAATADPNNEILGWTVEEGILLGLITGGMNGAGVGALTALAKKPQTLIVNGDIAKWSAAKAILAPVAMAAIHPK
jgi:hypothetical protein